MGISRFTITAASIALAMGTMPLLGSAQEGGGQATTQSGATQQGATQQGGQQGGAVQAGATQSTGQPGTSAANTTNAQTTDSGRTSPNADAQITPLPGEGVTDVAGTPPAPTEVTPDLNQAATTPPAETANPAGDNVPPFDDPNASPGDGLDVITNAPQDPVSFPPFAVVDTNGDGVIEPQEAEGLPGIDSIVYDLDVFREADQDSDGDLSPTEYGLLVQQFGSVNPVQQ